MSFNWLFYLNVANHLLSQRSEEYWRSAISRAYYAVFGVVRGILQSQGTQFKSDNIHRQVINRLKRHKNPTAQQIGVSLDRLRRERNKADYDDGISISYNEASMAIAVARKIQRDLPAL
mgnify:FL=1